MNTAFFSANFADYAAKKIKLIYCRFYSYSTELNPDERLNADLKHAITTCAPRKAITELEEKTREHMSKVSSSPEGLGLVLGTRTSLMQPDS